MRQATWTTLRRVTGAVAFAVLFTAGTAAAAPVPLADPLSPVLLPGNGAVAAPLSGTADLVVSVSLTAPSGSTVTADWTTVNVAGAPDSLVIGHQAAPTDYTPSSGVVTFAPGQTSAHVTIPVIEDSRVISDPSDPSNAFEYVVVSFTHPIGARPGGFYGLGFGIIDSTNYGPVPQIFYGEQTVNISTGPSTVDLPISLSEATNHVVTAHWSTVLNGDFVQVVGTSAISVAEAPTSDYTAASGTVTFPPGQTTASLPVSFSRCTCPPIQHFGPIPPPATNGEALWVTLNDGIGGQPSVAEPPGPAQVYVLLAQ